MPPNKIAVVGPGTVGMPMAALLASSTGTDGSPPPRVVVVQRPSAASGWKVGAINAGRSPIGGVEPGLDGLVARAVASGSLSATHDYEACSDAAAILVCVQTDKTGLVPDHAVLTEALEGVASALRRHGGSGRPQQPCPAVIVESTLAPSTMHSVVQPIFARHGLLDGEDVILGCSPSRVTPGRLVEQTTRSDKLVAGSIPETPVHIAALYRRIVKGRLLVTNSLTAEVVKTLESAFRDVRIAFAAEVVRHCDRMDVDFFTLRDQVNDLLGSADGASWDGTAVATGAMLVPTVGVGGPCLTTGGVSLWWRALAAGVPARNSLILAARAVNDASPAATVRMARLAIGPLNRRNVAVLGASWHHDSGDTHSAPSLVLANLLRDSGANVTIHDPYVSERDERLARLGLSGHFTPDLDRCLQGQSAIFLATPHRVYRNLLPRLRESTGLDAVIDACNLFQNLDFSGSGVRYTGIGRGRRAPDRLFVRSVASMYRAVATGVSNELEELVCFLNQQYADDSFNQLDLQEVRRLAATCPTGCEVGPPGEIEEIEAHEGFVSGLAQLAADAAPARSAARRVPPERVPAGLWFGNEDAVVPDQETPWPLTPRQ